MLLRTLQDANRLQILSRPQIMTMDNTEGFVQVGRLIARVNDIINNGVAGTQVVPEDVEVGLILRVQPRVGADGLIVMTVDATRSDRDTSSGTVVPLGGGDVAVIDDILTTTAQSTIAAYSGQTVVFGGLIQKTRANFSRRIPIVSDIPLIGNMFKYDQESERRSELLVVMTPMLVNGDEDMEYVKQVESSRMSWCLADVVEAHGDVGLSGGYGLWGPAVGATIYPDLQPTVDDVIIEESLPVPTEAPRSSGSSLIDSGPVSGPVSGVPAAPASFQQQHSAAPAVRQTSSAQFNATPMLNEQAIPSGTQYKALQQQGMINGAGQPYSLPSAGFSQPDGFSGSVAPPSNGFQPQREATLPRPQNPVGQPAAQSSTPSGFQLPGYAREVSYQAPLMPENSGGDSASQATWLDLSNSRSTSQVTSPAIPRRLGQ